MDERLTIVFLLNILNPILCKVCEDSLPTILQNCLSKCQKNVNKSLVYQREDSIYYYCQNQYLVQTVNETWNQRNVHKIKPESLNILTDIFKKFQIEDPVSLRIKRSTPIIRKEYRQLTTQERDRFHRALQAMKSDTSDMHRQPNVYDWFVNLHPADVAPSAHFGPGFLGFHRVYLFLFEQLLRRYEPDVFIPFWDSSFDTLLEEPTSSAMFSVSGMGPGSGVVREGPFSDWTHENTGVLVRNVGLEGGLFSREFIELFLRQNRIEDIGLNRNELDTNLEFHHGSVHNWVGGTLRDFHYSPADPLFFMHHCFVDALWERFRGNQVQRGFDPEQDAPMRPFESGKDANGESKYILNRIGFSKMWSSYAKYENPPYDCRVDSDCGSEQMRCERRLCQPLTIEEFERIGLHRRSKREISKTYSNPWVLPTSMKASRQHHTQSNTPLFHGSNARTTPFYHSCQNSFMIDGEADISKWVFIPVAVYKKRPKDQTCDAFPIRHGSPDYTGDVFDQSSSTKYQTSNKEPRSDGRDKCSHLGSGITKVYVKTFGLDYRGSYTDHALLDERLQFSSGLSAVGVKKPLNNRGSHVFITAHDSCGNMCTAFCLNTQSSPYEYQACSGAVRISPVKPLMYRSTVKEALLSAYNYSSISPTISKENIPIVFHCD
ncbi:tyrosinase-like protein 1 [Saccostrea cucullata]|uniref:tyrosinase-like protein 1 n=1 Tax=Saccostrea cuccullata TaxID=36930 RepID=UPI002ED19BEF